MSRRKGRTRRKPTEDVVILVSAARPADPGRSGWWGLVKAVAICGAAGGLVGAAAGAALLTDGYAVSAALIGGVPAGTIGACALGWYGRLFGFMNRLRHGVVVGGALGMLGAGSVGVVAGLSVWAFAWSLPGAILGAALQSSLRRPERRAFGLLPGVLAGALVGILVRAVRTGAAGVMTGASRGGLVGAVVGVLLIPALLAWLTELPEFLRRRRRRR